MTSKLSCDTNGFLRKVFTASEIISLDGHTRFNLLMSFRVPSAPVFELYTMAQVSGFPFSWE